MSHPTTRWTQAIPQLAWLQISAHTRLIRTRKSSTIQRPPEWMGTATTARLPSKRIALKKMVQRNVKQTGILTQMQRSTSYPWPFWAWEFCSWRPSFSTCWWLFDCGWVRKMSISPSKTTQEILPRRTFEFNCNYILTVGSRLHSLESLDCLECQIHHYPPRQTLVQIKNPTLICRKYVCSRICKHVLQVINKMYYNLLICIYIFFFSPTVVTYDSTLKCLWFCSLCLKYHEPQFVLFFRVKIYSYM